MPIMNMACSNAVEAGFAAVSKPETWSMPFLLRATSRLDLAGSEVNHDGDRAFDTPGQTSNATNTATSLHHILHQGTMR